MLNDNVGVGVRKVEHCHMIRSDVQLEREGQVWAVESLVWPGHFPACTVPCPPILLHMNVREP